MEKGGTKATLTVALAIAATLLAAVAAFGRGPEILLPPPLKVTYDAQPAPIPVPSEGRIPVSLRLAAAIEMEDGSHPPAAKELQFEFNRQFRLDLGDVPTCPAGVRSQSRTGKDPCPEARVAFGHSEFDVAFPGQEPVRVGGRTVAYKIDSRKLAIHTFLAAPVTADVVTVTELSRVPNGSVYGLRATANVPTVAGGHGSLVSMGLRFRKGLFSLSCPKRRYQSRLITRFADGTLSQVAVFRTC